MFIYGKKILYSIVVSTAKVDLILGQGEESACSPLCPHGFPPQLSLFVFFFLSYYYLIIIISVCMDEIIQ